MFLLRDSASVPGTNYNHVSSIITADGGIKSNGRVYEGYTIRRGEWFNYKLAVNLKTCKADIYINNKLVQQLAQNFASQSGTYTAHPRILLSQNQFDHLKNLYKTDPIYKKLLLIL